MSTRSHNESPWNENTWVTMESHWENVARACWEGPDSSSDKAVVQDSNVKYESTSRKVPVDPNSIAKKPSEQVDRSDKPEIEKRLEKVLDGTAAGETQHRIKVAIETMQNSLMPLDLCAKKARNGLLACHRQYLQDEEKITGIQIEIEECKKDKVSVDIVRQLQNRFDLLSQIVVDIEKNARLELAIVDKPVTARVQIACLRIASGEDNAISQGEKELLELVRENPGIQIDPDFNEAIVKAYLQMTSIRRDLKLGRWQCTLDQVQKTLPTNLRMNHTDPLAIMKEANKTFWNEGIEKALPFFAKAADQARKSQPDLERRCLQLFIDGLKLTNDLADAVTNGGNIEQLREQRKELFGEEIDAYEKKQIVKSIEVNIAFAKIASGRAALYKEGKAALEQWLERDPALLSNSEFKESLRRAFKTNREAVEKAKAVDEKPGNVQREANFKEKFDLSTIYSASLENDAAVRKYSSDVATDIGITALLLGSMFWMFRRQRNHYLANRAIRTEFGPVAVEGAPNSVVLKEALPNDVKERVCKVKGLMPGTDLMVLHDRSERGDWKHSSFGDRVPTGFDPKAGKYGDFRRLHVDGTDYYVAKNNGVYIHHKGLLHRTREIQLSNPAQFEKQSSCINSLLNVGNILAIRDMILSHEPGSPIYEKVSKFLNIPAPKIEFEWRENSKASYITGQGVITLSPETKSVSTDADRLDRSKGIIHELTHLEQDTLMIRRLADNLGIGKTCDGQQLEALTKDYEKAHSGIKLDADFAQKVLALRNGVLLTKSEEQRADNLMKDELMSLERTKIINHCKKYLSFLQQVDRLLYVPAKVTRAQANHNATEFYRRLAAEPEGRFRELFGVDPSPDIAKMIDKFRTLRDGELPRNFTVEESREALKICLENQFQLLNSKSAAPKDKSFFKANTSVYLAEIGCPAIEGPIMDIRSFCNKLRATIAFNTFLGEHPSPEILEIFERAADTNSREAWSEDKCRQTLKQHLERRGNESIELQLQNYLASGVEQEAWEVNRRFDASTVADLLRPNETINQGHLNSVELFKQITGNQNAREIATKIFEITSKPAFVNSTSEQKSKQLMEVVSQLLKEKLTMSLVDLPGSLRRLAIKVGDYERSTLEFLGPEHKGKNFLEIRIPEKQLGTTEGCIKATADIYADIYTILELDVKAGAWRSAASLLKTGSVLRGDNAKSLYVVCNHNLKKHDSPLFGEKTAGAFAIQSPSDRIASDVTVGDGKLSDRPPQTLIMMDGIQPSSNLSARAADANRQVNEILKPLREKLEAGEKVDPEMANNYYEKARDVLHPIANDTAETLGLPPVPRESIKFMRLRNGDSAHGAFDRINGNILINTNEKEPVTVIDHELQHKSRTLGLIAAYQADPRGFRLALLDACLKDIGQQSRVITEAGVAVRPAISDQAALREFRDIVRREVKFQLAEKGLLPWSEVPLEEPVVSEKLASFFQKSEVEVFLAAQKEAEHFAIVEKQHVLTADQFDLASKQYVARKSAQFKGDGSTPLKENPSVKKLLSGVGADTLGYFSRGNPELSAEYTHSLDEISSRKVQAAKELKRIRREMLAEGDKRSLSDHPQAKDHLLRLDLATHQQQMVANYRIGNMTEAKRHAALVFKQMCKQPYDHFSDVEFMMKRGLISSKQLLASPFAISPSEQDRLVQKEEARNITVERARANRISGSNLEAPKVLASGDCEYRLKTPATIEKGLSTEAKIIAIIKRPDGTLLGKYIDGESGKENVDEFYGRELLKELSGANGVDISKLTPEEKVKLVGDYISQIQTQELLGDNSNRETAPVSGDRPSVNSEIKNPESREPTDKPASVEKDLPARGTEAEILQKLLIKELTKEMGWPKETATEYVKTLTVEGLRESLRGLDNKAPRVVFIGGKPINPEQPLTRDEVTNAVTALERFANNKGDVVNVIEGIPVDALSSRTKSTDTAFYEQAQNLKLKQLKQQPRIYTVPREVYSQILKETCAEYIVTIKDPSYQQFEFLTIKPGYEVIVGQKVIDALKARDIKPSNEVSTSDVEMKSRRTAVWNELRSVLDSIEITAANRESPKMKNLVEVAFDEVCKKHFSNSADADGKKLEKEFQGIKDKFLAGDPETKQKVYDEIAKTSEPSVKFNSQPSPSAPNGPNIGSEKTNSREKSPFERRITPELHPPPVTPPAEGIETIMIGGKLYIQRIGPGEVTVDRIKTFLDEIEKRIELARGNPEQVKILEQLKQEYGALTTEADRQAYCKRLHSDLQKVRRTGSIAALKGAPAAIVGILILLHELVPG